MKVLCKLNIHRWKSDIILNYDSRYCNCCGKYQVYDHMLSETWLNTRVNYNREKLIKFLRKLKIGLK